MSIGVNWKEIWQNVWKAVWRQGSPSDETLDIIKPRSRVRASRLTHTVPSKPKVERKRKVAKLLPPIVIEEPPVVITPPRPLEIYAENLAPPLPTTGEFHATLEPCAARFNLAVTTGAFDNSCTFHITLEGAELEMAGKVQVYDDAISVYMKLPDLEPELVDA